MKKYARLLLILLFLAVTVYFIASSRSLHFFLPSQQVELSHGVEYGAVLKDFLFVQEITMQKRFISRIDLYMAKLPSSWANENVFLLLDEQRSILFTKRFSSNDFGEALYFPFDFGKKFDIGAGKKVYACIYSIDGDQRSYIGLAKKENSALGQLYVISILNNDVVSSFNNPQSRVDFTGSIGARTFESNTRFFTAAQVIAYLIAFAIAFILFFSRQVARFIRNSRIVPEYAYLGFSLTFGMTILAITPPFMVPDEPVHFYRSYQIAEFNIFKLPDDFPKSLVDLSAICNRMQFSTHEKTSPDEILSLANIKTNASVRTTVITPDYTLPYLPQALGIAVGKIFGLAPLWLFYLGRIFNLLASIALIFLAIRTIPIFKWVFFLLGVMPMTLYQVASMSYDAVTTGLSFLLLATLLQHAMQDEKQITRREIAVLFILSLLLAAAKQPYAIIILAYFIIPVKKFGSPKRYFSVFAALAITVAVVSQLWAPGRAVFEKLSHVQGPQEMVAMDHSTIAGDEVDFGSARKHQIRANLLPLLPHLPGASALAQEQSGRQSPPVQTGNVPDPDTAGSVAPVIPADPVSPADQKKFILTDPFRYIGILVNTLGNSLDLYLTSFVGLFGWIDAPMPPVVAYAYLAFLILFSLFGAISGKGIGWYRKAVLAGIFLVGFVLIETALYVYCNPVGCDSITAVQGRYFIAIAPLLFLLFANRLVPGFNLKRNTTTPGKHGSRKQKIQNMSARSLPANTLLLKSLPWLAMLVAAVTLSSAVFVLMERFYITIF